MESKEERILPAVLEAIPGVVCWLSHRTADEARMTCVSVPEGGFACTEFSGVVFLNGLPGPGDTEQINIGQHFSRMLTRASLRLEDQMGNAADSS